MIHIHRWTKWRASKHYTDTSWGGRARSTMLVKRCKRCGLARGKGLYGVYIPLEDEEPTTA